VRSASGNFCAICERQDSEQSRKGEFHIDRETIDVFCGQQDMLRAA